VATLDDVRRLALAMPEAVEVDRKGQLFWKVKDRLFVWERPLRASDLAALGDDAPAGVILGARVPDEGAKHALIASAPDIYFTTPHFNGYPAVLVRLAEISVAELEELVVEAWLDRAPPKLAATYQPPNLRKPTVSHPPNG
jgi:hypothetical protein